MDIEIKSSFLGESTSPKKKEYVMNSVSGSMPKDSSIGLSIVISVSSLIMKSMLFLKK